MKKCLKFILPFFIILTCSSCEMQDIAIDTEKNSEPQTDYVEAKYENFKGKNNFKNAKIHINGTLSEVISNGKEVFITDSEGNNWTFICNDNDHHFEDYVGKNCECYCEATGLSSFSNTVKINFRDNSDYRIIFDNGLVYSDSPNCTMHEFPEQYIAFGRGEEGLAEYQIFDLINHTVRNIRNYDEEWYYTDANYVGNPMHSAKAQYSDSFFETYVFKINNDNNLSLDYKINDNRTTAYAKVIDYNELNQKINELIANDVAKNNDTTIKKYIVTKAPTAAYSSEENSEVNDKDNNSNNWNNNSNSNNSNVHIDVPEQNNNVSGGVWVPVNGGSKYHSKKSCSQMNDPVNITKEDAESRGYTPCGRCF